MPSRKTKASRQHSSSIATSSIKIKASPVIDCSPYALCIVRGVASELPNCCIIFGRHPFPMDQMLTLETCRASKFMSMASRRSRLMLVLPIAKRHGRNEFAERESLASTRVFRRACRSCVQAAESANQPAVAMIECRRKRSHRRCAR